MGCQLSVHWVLQPQAGWLRKRDHRSRLGHRSLVSSCLSRHLQLWHPVAQHEPRLGGLGPRLLATCPHPRFGARVPADGLGGRGDHARVTADQVNAGGRGDGGQFLGWGQPRCRSVLLIWGTLSGLWRGQWGEPGLLPEQLCDPDGAALSNPVTPWLRSPSPRAPAQHQVQTPLQRTDRPGGERI